MFWTSVLTLTMVLMGGGLVKSNAQEIDTTSYRKIVVFQEEIQSNEKEEVVIGYGCRVIKHLRLVNAVVAILPESAPEQARQGILRDVRVVRIDDDLIVKASPAERAPKPKPQPPQEIPWGINRIDSPNAWTYSQGSAVKVAILDTGIDVAHPDLQTNVKGGVNTINPNKSYKDDNGHGSHVAGIVAAINNTIGVVGVGHLAYLYGVKVLDRNGNGWLSDIIEGLQWSIDNGMQVINMSLGSNNDNQSFHEAITKVYNAGITQVAAAGNESGVVSYPAKYSEVIAVTAINSNDQFAGFSNYGPDVDVTAPGVDIKSTYKDGGYKILSGTSMACPHVTGACALKLYQYPGLSPEQMANYLRQTAEILPGLTSNQQGAGLVDAEALVTTP